jgi:LysR family glycine cleavage system transcriptional activator
MRRRLPSTVALAAFEAAARHASFTLAADELAVTQSAVCRQVGALEAFLGVKLFRRTRHGMALTDAGERYARSVRERLDAVERDTLDLMAGAGQGDPAAGALELGVVPTFATRWLLPRLARFHERHPGITVHLSARTRPFLFEGSGLDAALHAATGGWPGTESEPVLPERLVAVASPALLAAHGAPVAPDDEAVRALLPRLPLLQIGTRPDAWRQWAAGWNLALPQDLAGPRLELFSMVSEAACQGLGAALVPDFLVAEELAQGRLVRLGAHAPRSERSYLLIWPAHQAGNPRLAAFREWLREETAAAGGGGRPHPAPPVGLRTGGRRSTA